MMRGSRLAGLAAGTDLLTACSTATVGTPTAETPTPGTAPDPARRSSVLAAARGQTVNWYLWGGNEGLNGYVSGWVTRRAAELGITVHPVKAADFVVYGTSVVGVAVGVGGSPWPFLAVLLAYYLNGSVFLAFSSITERTGRTIEDGRSLSFPAGLRPQTAEPSGWTRPEG